MSFFRPARLSFWLSVLAALCVVIGAARALLPTAPGLAADYFTPHDAASPARSVVDRAPSATTMASRWPPIPPAFFRVRWVGYLGIDEADAYTFTLVADDHASLTIDGTPVVDTGAGRGFFETRVTTPLAAGVHAVVVEYRQEGGDSHFDWTWARAGRAAETIPAWRLMTRRGAWGAQRAAHLIDVVLPGLLVLLVLGVAYARRADVAAVCSSYPTVALLVLFAALAVLETWPLASDPGHLSRNDNGDTVLNEWALAWVAHQAVTNPLHLFDANIFYPERYTLAYSESMLVQAAMAAPLLWLGASPVLAYNILLMLGFALNGWVMAYVIRRWTGDTVAGIAAGIFFAFNSNILTRLPHMQALHVEFIPLALLAWDRLLAEPRAKHAVRMGVMFALQGLTSVYLLVFTFATVLAAVVARAPEWLGARFRRVMPLLALAGVVAVAIATPFLLPYLWLNQVQGFERSADDAANMSATLGSYLASSSRFHYSLWSERFFSNPSALFPGITAVTTALFAFRRGTALRDPRARMSLAVCVFGVLLSFGPKIPGYMLLFTYVPIFRVVRVVSSFGYIGLMGLAMVAGFGMAELRRVVSARVWPVVAGAVLVLAVFEPMAAPLELVPFRGISPIHDLVRAERPALVVELPFWTQGAGFQQVPFMLNSTRHWQPMLNGYSGYRPQSFYDTAEQVKSFPSAESIAWLQQKGVTHLFVQMGAYDEGMPARLGAIPVLHEMASDRGVTLYRLDRAAER